MNTPKLPPLPERDPRKPAEQQGVFRKFDVRRTDGSNEPGGKHHGCEYFVLDVDHDQAARAALKAYADAVEATHPLLAADMRERYALAAIAAQGVPDGIVDILQEAASILEAVGERPNTAPTNMRYPIVDELNGFAAMLASAQPAPQGAQVDYSELPNTELPGMWDQSDFLGGATDCDAAKKVPQCAGDPGECAYNGACMYACGLKDPPAPQSWPFPGWEVQQAVRCELCQYQHGHQIGCANNPVDIALRAKAQQAMQAAVVQQEPSQAASPAHRPLTQSRIDDLFEQYKHTRIDGLDVSKAIFTLGVMAAETAHGIKE